PEMPVHANRAGPIMVQFVVAALNLETLAHLREVRSTGREPSGRMRVRERRIQEPTMLPPGLRVPARSLVQSSGFSAKVRSRANFGKPAGASSLPRRVVLLRNWRAARFASPHP